MRNSLFLTIGHYVNAIPGLFKNKKCVLPDLFGLTQIFLGNMQFPSVFPCVFLHLIAEPVGRVSAFVLVVCVVSLSICFEHSNFHFVFGWL